MTNYYYWEQSKSSWNCSNSDMTSSDLSGARINFFYEFNIMLREEWNYLEINSANSFKLKLGSWLLAFMATLVSKHSFFVY